MANLVTDIVEVPTDIDYWFFRTEGGNFFESFLDHDFVAMGWNNITLDDIRNKTVIEVKSKIERVEDIKKEGRSKKQKLSDIYNKIKRFDALQKGDIIVIPSSHSHLLAFGEIMDDRAFQAPAGEHGCDYEKRRHVKWHTPGIPLKELDPTFDKMRRGWHAIMNVNEYDYYIDSVVHSVYTKAGNSHLVIKVQQTSDINLKDLAEVLTGIQDLMEIVNSEFDLNENISQSSIKIYLQSPGLFNIKNSGIALLLTAMVMGSASCNTDEQPPETKAGIENIQTHHPDKIDSLTARMQNMNINF